PVLDVRDVQAGAHQGRSAPGPHDGVRRRRRQRPQGGAPGRRPVRQVGPRRLVRRSRGGVQALRLPRRRPPSAAGQPRMSAFTVDAAGALPGSDARRAERVAAAERLAAIGLPSEAEEVWRYSRISALDLGAYAPLPPDGAPGVPDAVGPALAATGERAGLLVPRDGRVV